jgi:glycosyltransferase involved in cell wall biosynthesis
MPSSVIEKPKEVVKPAVITEKPKEVVKPAAIPEKPKEVPILTTKNEPKQSYKYYISIGAVFKEEAHALDEWIRHYLKLGIDHIYLINDFSSDNFKDILDKYPYHITLFNNDIITDEFGRQMLIYEKYLKPVLNETEYMAILDLDEFLYSPSNISFKDFFNKHNEYSHYTISWLNFGSNKNIDQPPSLIEGFNKRAEIKNNDEINTWGFKSIFKTNNLKKFGIHKHECEGDTLILDAYSNEFVINHYIIQSLLFYLEVKCTRGSATNFMNCPNKLVVEQQRKTRARFNVIDKLANIVLDNRLLFQTVYVIYKKIVVFVPYCSVYENYIIQCLESIEAQEYPTYEVIIINDGHSDTKIIDLYIKDKSNYKLINFKENHGPAHSKWRFIEYIQQNISTYNYNDIAMIIDGDDYIEQHAFYTINKTYNSKNCWATYGNANGNFCQHNDKEIRDDWDNIRKFNWIYNHPRTCKIYLLTLFKEDDFKMEGKWLSKGTDRPFVYNCIEWSGKNRTQSIPNVIYQYIEHELNSYKTVAYAEKQAQLKYIENLTPRNKIIEDIHIVMCCWKRIDYLESQIINLNSQSVAGRIHIHLLNNNKNNIEKLNNLVDGFKKKYKIKIHLSHYENIYFGFQRFLYVKTVLLKNFILDYVLFMDDDQLFYYDWVECLYNKREPNTYICWYGRKWEDEMNYWTGSIINMTECRTNTRTEITEFDYGATCGCIIDVNIFNENTELWDIPKNLPKNVTVYNIEDLWLSYVVRYFYNWKIKRSFLPEKETINEIDNCGKHSLYLSLYEEKQKLFEHLTRRFVFTKTNI